jgi:hypothetical protein
MEQHAPKLSEVMSRLVSRSRFLLNAAQSLMKPTSDVRVGVDSTFVSIGASKLGFFRSQEIENMASSKIVVVETPKPRLTVHQEKGKG